MLNKGSSGISLPTLYANFVLHHYRSLAFPLLPPLASAGESPCAAPQSLPAALPAGLRAAFAELAVPLSLAAELHGLAASPSLLLERQTRQGGEKKCLKGTFKKNCMHGVVYSHVEQFPNYEVTLFHLCSTLGHKKPVSSNVF